MKYNPLASMACAALIAVNGAAHAQASSPVIEPEITYGTLSGGLVMRVGTLSHQISLSGGAVPIRVDGVATLNRGTNYTLALGRQWHEAITREDPEPRHWRLEGEWWSASVPREKFQSRLLQVALNDEMTITGLYANALVRVNASQDFRWWAGAGIGHARVRLPDANSLSAGCGCLGSSSASGASIRLKTLVEHPVSEKVGVYGEAVYTRLPQISASGNTYPQSSIQVPSPLSVNVGLKARF